MFVVFSVLIVIASIFLILIVLVQNSKGGGLASNFSSSNQVMGVRRTTDFLEKATWYLAIAVVVFSLVASLSIPKQEVEEESKIQEKVENAVDPTLVPPTSPIQNVNQPTTETPKEESK
jgi:preprotein translocase subunit SecG